MEIQLVVDDLMHVLLFVDVLGTLIVSFYEMQPDVKGNVFSQHGYDSTRDYVSHFLQEKNWRSYVTAPVPYFTVTFNFKLDVSCQLPSPRGPLHPFPHVNELT